MKLTVNWPRIVLLVLLGTSSVDFYAQNTLRKPKAYVIDTSLFANFQFSGILTNFQIPLGSISHSPQKEDYQCYSANKSLINQLPTEKNHEKYFQLACSLWEIKKIPEAEKMFLNIVNSNGKFYTSTYSSSSDIPGDATTNTYGYGSYTWHYKNSACIYLSRIYIEQKKFTRALTFVNDAVKKYIETYTCGTGYLQQQRQYQFLYASCYQGLGRNNDILDLLLPQCLERDDNIIINAVRKLYTTPQIKRYLSEAEKSITCIPDTFRVCSVTTKNYGEENETRDTSWYYSGTGTINLFGRKIELPRPALEDGERVTRKHFIKAFKESSFYSELHGDNKTSYRTKPVGQY